MDINYYDLGSKFIGLLHLSRYDKSINYKSHIIEQLDKKGVINDYIDGLVFYHEKLSLKLDHYTNIDDDGGIIAAKLTYYVNKLKAVNNTIQEIYSYFDSADNEYDEDGDYITDNIKEADIGKYFKKIFNTKEKVNFYTSSTYRNLVNSGEIIPGYLPSNWRDLA